MRIAIVNDMALAIEALRRVVSSSGEHEVTWMARDGEEALRRCREDTPDLILMDLVMPVMDGVEATRRIMAECPCAILIVTASVSTHGELVYEAMGYGALDAAVTPTLGPAGELEGGRSLLDKIAHLGYAIGHSHPRNAVGALPPVRQADSGTQPPLVVVGASTGGPQALAALLSGFEADFPAPVVIVQHVDPDFAAGLAEWLNHRCELSVRLAANHEVPQVGEVLIAGRDQHLMLRPGGFLAYSPEPHELINRPSVDVLFDSAAHYWLRGGIAVLLTGMGRDGAEGMLSLRHKGWHTIAQDESTSVVYGMPKAAVTLKAACEVLPLPAIAGAVKARLKPLLETSQKI
ncbi:chemotaxis response regulator protein-glutamate methylesterase [Ruficoccus amylovorans]|uniref:Protein-glutamate methylesterase/protein-glutamine glutaminase n=1 Tax=Ruficoccus amylovorans TaxID=1804625 RepID=A0A842HG55_9BACT|nr:chemotaxis response regulator protein-glutamate methylesterase [Ruficoccus amylovorans]